MSRRSKRLGTTEQEDDRISTSSVESHGLYRDSPARSLRKKVTTLKYVPKPHQTTSHSYYSETSGYISRDRDVATAQQDKGYEATQWDKDLLQKRMELDITYNINSSKTGFSGTQPTYDKSTSSSGYSSEEDFTRRLFGLLYWWFGTTWYRLTTSASLLDVFILTRHYAFLKKMLMILLLMLLLALIAAGLWHFYPFGLQNAISLPTALFSWKQKLIADAPQQQKQNLFTQTELVSRLESLEKQFQKLENQQKKSKSSEKNSVAEHGLSRDQVAEVFYDFSTHRESNLKEEILQETSSKAMHDLRILRAEQEGNLQEILEKMHQLFREVNGQVLAIKSELQSSSHEDLKGNFMLEMGKLERWLTKLEQQLDSVKSNQDKMSLQMEDAPREIERVKDEIQVLFPKWLKAQTDTNGSVYESLAELFLHRDELHKYLLDLEKKILDEVSADKKQWEEQTHNSIDREFQVEGLSGVSRKEVHEIVKRALQRYSEDRIGLVDYALESSGASVINTRCSETYETKTALLSLFGIPLWYQSQSPRVILQTDSNPGNCWAFRGSRGYAVIRLSSRVRPTAVTLDHIPRSLSPKATISSAPKDFSVYGLEEETQKEGILLGNFTYNQNGDPIQTFSIKGENTTYQLIELRIESNWGHPEYTCIYRFRVHGETDL
uniref:Sad1 and UNC84 domain containing 2 n=1 Tax=Leptobrachium leishanense TaxID=445787 RepID=A0A8C5Q1K8_9ANUR